MEEIAQNSLIFLPSRCQRWFSVAKDRLDENTGMIKALSALVTKEECLDYIGNFPTNQFKNDDNRDDIIYMKAVDALFDAGYDNNHI